MLACDFAKMGEEAKSQVAGGADFIHLDVMDGNFVPNLSMGMPVISSLRKCVGDDIYFDCHMMVANPLQWVKPIKESGGTQYTFHIEAAGDKAKDVCCAIRDEGMKVGVALKPGTPATAISQIISLVDVVLVMTVEPGWGGQSFMPNCMPKVLELRTSYPELTIEVDGGLGPSTIDQAAKAGANMIVAGSACFKAGVPRHEPIDVMRHSLLKYGHGKEVSLPQRKPSAEKGKETSLPLPLLLAAAAAVVAVFTLRRK